VAVLDQRNLLTDKKYASDAAYTMAHQLLATQLNLPAGAESCQAVLDIGLEAEALLDAYDFDATARAYLGSHDGQDYEYALDLSDSLDQYNNGNLCTP